jgi:exopolysaccharide biosynthesis polyprenyl glycosylphosphotransferase
MSDSTRAIGRRIKGDEVRRTVVASAAPAAEPPSRTGRTAVETPRPELAPRNRPQRSGRLPQLPSLPPAEKAPAHFTPLVLFVVQTVLDMVAIGAAFGLSYWVRFESDIFQKFVQPDTATYVTMLVVTVTTIVTTFYFSKLYNQRRGASRVDEFYRIAGAVSMGTVLSLATNSLFLADRFVYSRQILLMGWFLTILFVTVSRLVFSAALGELRKRGVDKARVVVIGTGANAAVVIDRLRYHRTLGYEVLAAIDANGGHDVGGFVRQVPVIGDLSRLREYVQKNRVDEVIVALNAASDRELRDIIVLLQDVTVSVKVYPDAFQLMTENELSVGELSGLPLLSVKDVALRGWNRILKRAFDIAFSLIMLVLVSPVLLIVALLVKISSPGPVFFIQERVGLDNKPFQLVKFRTMRDASDPVLKGVALGNAPGWTVANDPRRTTIGTLLRRFSLDELPQFYIVLVGEMSVVGPRPEQPHYVQEFAQRIPQYLRRHREKAGLTGWAQVNGLRGDTSIELRTAADLYYVENWSLLFDLKIIARTVVSMVRGKNAY